MYHDEAVKPEQAFGLIFGIMMALFAFGAWDFFWENLFAMIIISASVAGGFALLVAVSQQTGR